MTILAWPIEVGSRELDERLVFALIATRRGFSVLSGTKTSVTEAATIARYEVAYIHKSASEKQLARFRVLRAAGVSIAVHDEEGLVTDERWFAPRLHPASLAHVNQYFYYGNRHQSLALTLGAPSGPSTVTGHPRYDLLSGPLSSFYRSHSQRRQHEFGRYVLVAATDRSVDAQLLLAKEFARQNFIDSIVIKLHPGSHKLFPHLKNQPVEVIAANDVIGPLILGAKALFHDASTTALAASMVGVAGVNFAPTVESGLVADDRVFGASAESINLSQLTTLLDGSLVNPSETGDILHCAESSACDRILNVLESDGATPGGEKSVSRSLLRWRPRKSLSNLSDHGRFKAGSLEPVYVAHRLEAMAKKLGIPEPRIKFFGDSAFMIYPS